MYQSVPVSKARAQVGDIEALANFYAPAIRDAIIAALAQQQGSIDLDALAEVLAQGDITTAMAMIHTELGMNGVADAAAEAIWGQGAAVFAATAAQKPIIRGVEWHFDKLNPALVDWMQRYKLDLIREIGTRTREAVRGALDKGIRAGVNPRVMARDIKTIVGLTNRQAAAVSNFRKELETFHARRSASGYNLGAKIDRANGYQALRPAEDGSPKDGIRERRLRDFRYDKTLVNAMKSGKPLKPEMIDKMVEAYANKYRKYRAETIARTESIRAVNAGVQEGWRQAIVQGAIPENLVRRYWKVAKDERTCVICNGIPKLNAKGVPFAMPFACSKGPIFLPPQHPDCRCHVFIRMHEPQELGLTPA